MDGKPPGLATGLYALLDDTLPWRAPPLELAAGILAGGAAVVQVRLKRTPEREALALSRGVVALAHAAGAQAIVNDRADWALLAGADGVHLGQEDLPVAAARRVLGPAALLGKTVRTLADIERAAEEGADHVGLGPIFPTRTKALADQPLGLERFAALVGRSRLPVVGISGVGLSNIAGVARAGARAAAVASDLLLAADVRARAAQLGAAFAAGRLGVG